MTKLASQEQPQKVVLIEGDGIGPEISGAVKQILQAAQANVEFVNGNLGEVRDASGHTIDSSTPEGLAARNEELTKTSDLILKHKIVLKAPTETPHGGGSKSSNVTARKGTGMLACIRRTQALDPVVKSFFPEQNLTIFRENEEGLYAAIEHQQTPDVVQALSPKSRTGMHKIIHAAFEDALDKGRTKVTCLAKQNILKMTEGDFLKAFNEEAKRYPTYRKEWKDGKEVRVAVGNLEGVPEDQQIEITNQIIDIGMARVATQPQNYQVIVTENMFGDILTDIAAELTGSVGVGGSSNIGPDYAMFEAIHGTAPDIAGQNKANPSGLLMAALDMLEYIGGEQNLKAATQIRDAWLWTLAQGKMTGDLARKNPSATALGSKEFTEEVIHNLGRIQKGEAPDLGELARMHIDYSEIAKKKEARASQPGDTLSFASKLKRAQPYQVPDTKTTTMGADLFVQWTGLEPESLALYSKQTNIDLASVFNIGAFHSIQELYDNAQWYKAAIDEAVKNGGDTLGSTATNASLKEWGVADEIQKGLSDTAQKMPLAELKAKMDAVLETHQAMVMASSQSLATRLQKVADASLFKLELISNRGEAVWPHTIDPTIADHMGCRFELKEPTQASDEKAVRVALAHLRTALANDGIIVTQEQPLRTFNGKEGYGGVYGQGWGTDVTATMHR